MEPRAEEADDTPEAEDDLSPEQIAELEASFANDQVDEPDAEEEPRQEL